MSDFEETVECGIHGKRTAAFVCTHLLTGERLGFNCGYDPDDPDTLYPDAWCDECESVLDAEGEWNEEASAYADIRLLCSACYADARARNWIQDEAGYHALVCSGVDYLQDKQAAFAQEFRINEHERWDWYQESRRLVFSHEGTPQVEAEVDFSGTLASGAATWMWAWANASLMENVRLESRKMRAIGEQYGYLNLACASWPASEEDGWEMTAIMAKESGCIGVYRTPGDSAFTYMVVRNARWLSSKG